MDHMGGGPRRFWDVWPGFGSTVFLTGAEWVIRDP